MALLLAAALALSLLAGCGGGKNQSLSQMLLNLLDGQYQNVSVEIDSDLEAKLRQAISQSETDEELRAALEQLLGGGISFQRLGSGQQGDSAWTLIIYPGTDPDAAARSVYLDLDKVFAALPDDGVYSSGFAMAEMENGYAILVRATVDKAGTEDKPDPVTLKSIKVTKEPDDKEYWVGESFDPKGMVITATYSNNTTKDIDAALCSLTINGADATEYKFGSAGSYTVTISYGGQTTTVKVEVKEPEVEKIEVSGPTDTIYTPGDLFNPTGMVITATYSDNVKTETINSDYENKGVTWEPTTIAADTEKVTIKYQGKEAEVPITLTPPTLDGITVVWSTEETYYTGDSITKSGVVTSVKADHSYGSDPTLKSDEYELTIKPKDSTGTATVITDDKPYTFPAAGEYTLTVTYDKYQNEKTIKVENNGYTVSEDGKTYSVSNAEGLKSVAELVNNDWKLDIDITLTDDINLTGIDWTPICPDNSKKYTGTFDGGNHTITGLTVTTDHRYAGLFGQIGPGGTVKNVVLTEVNITSGTFVGGVAGWSFGGNIENCSVSGSVSGSSGSDVGGVVGYQQVGSITGCSSSATVKGTERAGGVVGVTNGGTTTLTACYATGDVTVENDSSSNAWAGGIVGMNGTGTLIACYATGKVSGNIVGGAVGVNYATVTACYWSGSPDNDNGGATKVDGQSVTWQMAVNAMNTALGGAGWRYELTGTLPTLKKQ